MGERRERMGSTCMQDTVLSDDIGGLMYPVCRWYNYVFSKQTTLFLYHTVMHQSLKHNERLAIFRYITETVDFPDRLDSIMERTITEHEGDPGNDGEARDHLDDLLSIANDGDQGSKLDRIDVKGLIW